MAIYNVEHETQPENDGAIRVVGMLTRTWKCWAFPRALLDEVQRKNTEDAAGAYVLWGKSPEELNPRVYVGESDEVFKRLANHKRSGDKDFWRHTVVFTTEDRSMHKTHVQYLEAELIKSARENTLIDVMNATTPKPTRLSKHDDDAAKAFHSEMLNCLAILGVDFFRPEYYEPVEPSLQTETENETDADSNAGQGTSDPEPPKEPPALPPNGDEATPLLAIKRRGISAFGYPDGNEFVLLAGSTIVGDSLVSTSLNDSRKQLRNRLINGDRLTPPVVQQHGDFYRLTSDFRFSSSSLAASVSLGVSASGNREWSQTLEYPAEINSDQPQDGIFMLSITNSRKGIEARGVWDGTKLIVRAGSKAAMEVAESFPQIHSDRRTELVGQGLLKDIGDAWELTDDVEFNSPSAASAFILGRTSNGFVEWKDSSGRSLRELQDQ